LYPFSIVVDENTLVLGVAEFLLSQTQDHLEKYSVENLGFKV